MPITKEKFVALLKKYPVAVGCGVLSFSLAAFAYLRSDALPQAEAELTTTSALADRLSQNIVNSAHLKDQLESIKGSASTLSARILKNSAIADNQRYFYRLESACGVKLIDLRQGAALEIKGLSLYQAVPFNVVVQGPFSRVTSFLRELESGQHFCRLASVVLSPAAGGSTPSDTDSVTLTMSINVEIIGVP